MELKYGKYYIYHIDFKKVAKLKLAKLVRRNDKPELDAVLEGEFEPKEGKEAEEELAEVFPLDLSECEQQLEALRAFKRLLAYGYPYEKLDGEEAVEELRRELEGEETYVRGLIGELYGKETARDKELEENLLRTVRSGSEKIRSAELERKEMVARFEELGKELAKELKEKDAYGGALMGELFGIEEATRDKELEEEVLRKLRARFEKFGSAKLAKLESEGRLVTIIDEFEEEVLKKLRAGFEKFGSPRLSELENAGRERRLIARERKELIEAYKAALEKLGYLKAGIFTLHEGEFESFWNGRAPYGALFIFLGMFLANAKKEKGFEEIEEPKVYEFIIEGER